jgi:hypothetical protein
MRLNEFADPKDYTPTANNAVKFPTTAFAYLARPMGLRAGQQKTATEPAGLRRAINRESGRRRSTSQSPWPEPMVGRVVRPCPASAL